MKTKVVGSIGEFMNPSKPIKSHWEKYGFLYKVVGTTVIILVAGGSFDYVFAASALDAGANKVYYKLVEVGKWIIIFKGGIETIKAAAGGDFDTAKAAFFKYLITYLLLLGLPYGFNEIDKLFAELKAV